MLKKTSKRQKFQENQEDPKPCNISISAAYTAVTQTPSSLHSSRWHYTPAKAWESQNVTENIHVLFLKCGDNDLASHLHLEMSTYTLFFWIAFVACRLTRCGYGTASSLWRWLLSVPVLDWKTLSYSHTTSAYIHITIIARFHLHQSLATVKKMHIFFTWSKPWIRSVINWHRYTD